MKVKCDNCHKQINVRPYKLKHFVHHFCSQRCYILFRVKKTLGERPRCLNPKCGRPVNSRGAKFCSQSCKLTYQWDTIWLHRTKGIDSKWRGQSRRKETFIVKCPPVMSLEFGAELKNLVTDMNYRTAYRGIGTIEIRHGA